MGSIRCRNDTYLNNPNPEDKELADYIADTMDLKPARHSSMIERRQNFKRRLMRRVTLIGAMRYLKGAAQFREEEGESEPDVLGGHLSEECKGVFYPAYVSSVRSPASPQVCSPRGGPSPACLRHHSYGKKQPTA
jgi:hypothetical protein